MSVAHGVDAVAIVGSGLVSLAVPTNPTDGHSFVARIRDADLTPGSP
jgi:hypothetical protein